MADHFVFVRFCFGYHHTFPFERFAGLSDAEIAAELAKLRAERCTASEERSRPANEALQQRIAEWNGAGLTLPRGADANKRAPSSAIRELESHLREESLRPLRMDRYPVLCVPTEEDAQDAVRALQAKVAELVRGAYEADEWTGEHHFLDMTNPHFSVVAESDLSRWERVRTREQLERLPRSPAATAPPEEVFLRCYMPHIKNILKAYATVPTPEAAEATPIASTKPRTQISRDGAMWTLRYGDEEGRFPVSDFAALDTVATLVASPGRLMELADLLDAKARAILQAEAAASLGDADDPHAFREYQQRLDELQRDMRDSNPLVRAESAKELDKLVEHLRRIRRPGGQSRRLGRDQFQRAWESLTKSLKRLWPRLRANGMPKLATHFESSFVFFYGWIAYCPRDDTVMIPAPQ